MKNLYIIKITENDTGVETIFGHAFTNMENALYYRDQFNRYHDHISTASVETIELPFIGRSVCYIYGYYGIGGGFGVPMHHMIENSQVYSCSADAKHDPIWQTALGSVDKHPEVKHHVTDIMIATDDYGEAFNWGYGGFNVSVKRIRVIKAGTEYDENIVRWSF